MLFFVLVMVYIPYIHTPLRGYVRTYTKLGYETHVKRTPTYIKRDFVVGQFIAHAYLCDRR
jgi:hypothetical protein